ncbi:choice-of-anchor Q domain-containing protein [Xanthocytophaga agilis]|uniref:Choice-of-anchor Q domain-containing protein n=1 Tax=Xanthocytophaga agilis TaxID=3048010 RepID=A0AAE3R8D9_9BACT|nr:choice-of-anchor Q domain-containing protein [Xanthocytophaga agilis]MDJ1502643.1 choice-of-anchor Q domain-containing protein [Xanthocytophaga agilis]
MRFLGKYICLLILLTLCIVSCKPQDEILTDNPKPVTFSEDAIVFDTVFTALTTTTEYFFVRNPNKNAVLIKSVHLGNPASPYSVIISGRPITSAKNIELRGGDSLLVMVKMDIPSKDSSKAFVLYDSLMFDMQDTMPNIKLLAWGQDAVFVKEKQLSCNQTWTAEKPYILFDSVIVSENCQLTIEKGAKIYAYNNAALVVNGTLKANGTISEPIQFMGFRQDGDYREASGLWTGLSFRGSNKGSLLNFVQIRNATNAIFIDSPDTDSETDVTIQNTIIQYARQSGILGIESDIHAINTRITQCGEFYFAGLGGGNYRLWHCTLVGTYYLLQRENGALLFSDYVKFNSVDRENNLFCEVKNTVVWGTLANEVDFVQNTNYTFTQNFSHNLLKTPANALIYNATNLLSIDPDFTSITQLNFLPQEASPLVDAGENLGVTSDLKGKPRDSKPDIGAYEK